MFFKFFKWYKLYQIAQCITNMSFLLGMCTVTGLHWQQSRNSVWCFVNASFWKVCNYISDLTLLIFRSSRPEMFCEKGVLKNLAKFTGKHLRWSFFFNKEKKDTKKRIKKETLKRCFSVNFAKFSVTPFSQNTSGGCFWRLSESFYVDHWQKKSSNFQELPGL